MSTSNSRCNEWMPQAKVNCGRRAGHSGAHYSPESWQRQLAHISQWRKESPERMARAKEHARTADRKRMADRTRTSWRSMIGRCRYPAHPAWVNYGGRGITVCERWESYENFLADMGERPDGKTLDRIDVNGNYEPANCRWATDHEQARNRRNTRHPDLPAGVTVNQGSYRVYVGGFRDLETARYVADLAFKIRDESVR